MFKVGDKLVSIENDHYLTKGKIYIAEQVYEDTDRCLIFMSVDRGIAQWYDPEQFIELREYRKQKLQKIQEICLSQEIK